MLRAADLGILADDLTGACDAASSFTAACGPVRVYLRPPHGLSRGGPLQVVNTQSRLLPPAASRRRVWRTARLLRGEAVVYKKTDSVLRGPAGAELEGMARALPGHAIHVIPAVPDMGKTTRNGCLFERGIPAHQTDYGTDPLSPLATNDIRRIIASTGKVRFAVEDVESNPDLDRVVAAALQEGRVVLAGSVGLADALARRLEPREQAAVRMGRAERVLVLCGSSYAASREQMRRAASALGRGIIAIGENTSPSEAARQCAGGDVALLGIQTESVLAGRRLSSLFARVRRVILSFEPRALGIIGGETAYRILRLLGATRLDVRGKIQQGLAFGTIVDGEFRCRSFATKGGSVGSPDACLRMIQCLATGETGES
jgi:D-threonate/D-erythronate kinase